MATAPSFDVQVIDSQIRVQLRECAEADMAEQEAIEIIVGSLTEADEHALAVIRVIDMARQEWRRVTRAAEKDVSEQIVAGVSTLPELRKQLTAKTFRLADGTRCIWETATAAQHRSAAGMYRAQSDGLIRSAELHERVAKMIEDAGVNCLAEI